MNSGMVASLTRSLYLTLPITMFLLAGCGSEVERIVEQTVEQNYKIDPNARVSIRNTDGSIRIYGADTPEIKLQAVKKAYSKDRLDKIVIDVGAQPASISIDTIYPPKPKLGLADRSGTVDYVIVVPQSCTISRLELSNGEMLIEGMRGRDVHASLVNGHLVDRNCFGDQHLFVANGTLDIGYDWWEKHKFLVDAKIVHGNARAFIPGEASFHVLATTDDGNVACDFTPQESRHGGSVQKIDTVVNGPSEAEFQIHATNGTVKIVESNP
jgi:hypothetical protein